MIYQPLYPIGDHVAFNDMTCFFYMFCNVINNYLARYRNANN